MGKHTWPVNGLVVSCMVVSVLVSHRSFASIAASHSAIRAVRAPISPTAVDIVAPPTVSDTWRQRSPKRRACSVSAALGGSSRAATTTTVLERPPRGSRRSSVSRLSE